MKKIFILIFTLSLLNFGFSQDKWSVNDPQGNWNHKSVNLQSDEGTWISADVSPNGKQIVFDVLGDIFIMPIEGGDATLLKGGLAWESQPRFNPTGDKIAFTSDAGGADNIWTMNIDGTDAKQITEESFRLLNNPVWMPDGNYIVARKHFTSTRSLGAGEMWMYHITGGSGTQLTKRKNDQQDVNEPNISADGNYLYYSEDMYPGGYFQYNKDPNKEIYVINRYNFEKGETERVSGGNGSSSRPVVSHDGKFLAFVKRIREKSVLYLQNLKTGEEWPVYDELDKDQMEAWAIFGTYPNFAWTPDDKNLVFWAKGKIQKLDINTKKISEIPFSINTELKIAEALRFKKDAYEPEFTAKAIRHAVTSKDNKWVVFNAAGYLWKKNLTKNTVERVSEGIHFEYEPSFSSDGKYLTYVTWDDETSGTIMKIEWGNKKAEPIKISKESGIYREPSFSPDGSKIVFRREGGSSHMGLAYTKKTGIYIMSSNGGELTFVRESGSNPTFNLNGDKIYYQGGGMTLNFSSVKLDGTDQKTHITSKYGTALIPSPDEKWVALTNLHNVYIMPFLKTGKTIELTPNSKSIPVTRISQDAGVNVHWSMDSKSVNWTLGQEYFSADIAERFTFLEGSPDSIPPIDTVGININLKIKYDKPSGYIALLGARIITMEGDEIIEDGTIIINENRIEKLGPRSEISIPKKAKIINVEGKTIMPGIVDVHAHVGHFRTGLSPRKHWQYYANLAYGVTTSHDPSASTEMVFSQAEMIKAGRMVGPRIFSTGTILYGADGNFKAVINSLDDARSAIRRTKAFGAISVKSYNQPRREQRQQVIKAARELEIMVVPEGGSTFFHNMSMIMDGHTGIEHNIPVTPIYTDVKTLWSNSKTGYTPTLVVNYGGMSGEYYWYQTTNVWENEKLLKYTPRNIIDSRARHRTMVPMEEYENGHIATSKVCKSLSDLGVKVNIGAHGQLQGLGAHWELWMLNQGGMSNMETLRSATWNGAHYIGMEDQIGSLKEGKLADLIVLEKNPLEDIYNTNSVTMTMINGRLYDTETMDEIGNYDNKRTKFYWENEKYASFDWFDGTHTIEKSECSCSAH